jgi:ATP-dependent DNA ligase
MRPMLAFKWQDHQKKFRFPCHVQPKLNGIRMLYQAGYCQSRDEHVWSIEKLRHIRESLRQVPSRVILDGELYIHGKSLQRINALCSLHPNAKVSTDEIDLEYHVFDCLNSEQTDWPFSRRSNYLRSMLATFVNCPTVKFVPTHEIASPAEAEYLYSSYRADGYEGLMYRESSSPYGLLQACGNKENRWKCLLKRKDWQDAEFEIVSFETTTGDKGETGFRLGCRCDNGAIVYPGSGLSDLEVQAFMAEPPIGKLARLRFEVYSDSGIPLKPTIEAIL